MGSLIKVSLCALFREHRTIPLFDNLAPFLVLFFRYTRSHLNLENPPKHYQGVGSREGLRAVSASKMHWEVQCSRSASGKLNA